MILFIILVLSALTSMIAGMVEGFVPGGSSGFPFLILAFVLLIAMTVRGAQVILKEYCQLPLEDKAVIDRISVRLVTSVIKDVAAGRSPNFARRTAQAVVKEL